MLHSLFCRETSPMNAARGDPGGPEAGEAPIGAQQAARARILVNAFHCHPTAGLQTKDKPSHLPTLVLNLRSLISPPLIENGHL